MEATNYYQFFTNNTEGSFTAVYFKENLEHFDTFCEKIAAQLYGARVFNQNHNNPVLDVYGAVSNGFDWQFLFLEGNTIYIDEKVFSITNLPLLLGILQSIVNKY